MRFPILTLLVLLLPGLASLQLCAQQVNLSLHPTAVPDSFEVRATATSGIFTYLPNAVFTLRWELSSGGVANNSDVRRPCGVFPVYNYVGTQDVGAYRYFPLILNGERNMDNICPIDTGGTVLCGVRIRELLLQAEMATVTGPCLNYYWNGSIWPSDSPEWVLNGVSGQSITLEISNGCGNASIEFTPPSTSMNYFNLNLCGTNGDVDLNQVYMDYLVAGGLWLANGLPVSGIYQPSVDSSITYFYQLPNGCDRLRVGVNDYPSHNAGTNASIQICTDSDPVDLFPLLGPNAEPGGSWTYAIGDSFSGIFDPDDFFGTFTIVFRYGVGSDWTCWDTAFVTVTETPGPFPWYADADGDGMGDPLDSVLSCDPIPGFVTVAGDACPTVPGTIGSPCDDGLAWTLNDTLDANCLCMGIPTAVVEQDDARWRLWPNPAKDQVYLQAPPLGAVSITVLDIRGRVVQVLERHLGNGPVNWPTTGLARGSYAVRILSPHAVRVMRLVVQ